jgi:hypothetical protein
MNKKIIFSLIAISLSVFITLAFSNSVKADSIPIPSYDSDFVMLFDEFSAYPGTVNGASIFDNQLLFIGPWDSTVSSVDYFYPGICTFSYNSGFSYSFSYYGIDGSAVVGSTSSSFAFRGCDSGEPIFYNLIYDSYDTFLSDVIFPKLDYYPEIRYSFFHLYYYPSGYPLSNFQHSIYLMFYIDEENNIHLLTDDLVEYSSAVNGSCGSANNSSFSVFPSDNLCSSGVICSGQPYTDGTYYYWTCYGYGPGATSEDCRASVLVSTAQCGYLANTQYSDSSPPSGSNACLSGSVRDMLQLDDDSWLWYCEVSDDDFVPCSTFSDNPIVITPSLPSSPDIACGDILTGQGFANCISSVFAWLFLPHQDTIDEFFQLGSLIKTKIPFGYVYSFRDEINNLTSSSSSDFSIALTFNGDDQVPVVNSDTFDVLGSDFKSTYFRFIRAILWISFGVWVFTLGRKLFLNNRDS